MSTSDALKLPDGDVMVARGAVWEPVGSVAAHRGMRAQLTRTRPGVIDVARESGQVWQQLPVALLPAQQLDRK